jgi:predicted dienelactone hydrolase
MSIPGRASASPRASAVGRSRAPKRLSIRILRFVGGLLLALLIGVLTAAALSAVMRSQVRTLPVVTGPSPVGRTAIALTDTARLDPFATDGRSRELTVWIWYPAAAGSSGPAAPYLPAAWIDLVSNEGVFSQDLNAVRTNSITDAPLEGRPPVVVLVPGLPEPVASYTALAEDLASHGYAVVGINPTGSTGVVFPDGHVTPATSLGQVEGKDVPSWYSSAERVTNVWVADAAFVVRTLAADPPQIGALDLDRVAYVGHSLGGAASFQACKDNARCAAAVDLDGTLWTEVRHTGLEAPSLVVRAAPPVPCDAFCVAANADFATVDEVGDSTQVSVAGSTHQNFSDMGLLWRPLAHLGALGSIDAGRMTQITRGLVLSFLDEHVRDATAGTFATTASGYPEVR